MSPTHLSETLRQDYQRGNETFHALSEARKEKDRLQRVFDLQNTVIPQVRAENKEIVSRLEGSLEGFDANAARQELQQIEDELMQLAREPVDRPEFEQQLEKVRGTWEDHVQKEENTLLSRLDSAVGADGAEVLKRYTEERERHTRSGQGTGRNWMGGSFM